MKYYFYLSKYHIQQHTNASRTGSGPGHSPGISGAQRIGTLPTQHTTHAHSLSSETAEARWREGRRLMPAFPCYHHHTPARQQRKSPPLTLAKPSYGVTWQTRTRELPCTVT